jgi:hypothetical protein
MRFEYYIICTLTLVVQGHTLLGQDEFERINGSENWVLQFSDPCTENWQDNWFLDGKIATVKNSENGMNFKAGPVNGNDAHHAVLWTKESFEGDVKIEYNYTRTDSQKINVNILYIQATGIGKGPYQKDISQWNSLRKVPAMSVYFKNMKTLHVSYAAYGTDNDDPWTDYIRVRQYPVTENIKFADIAIQPDFYNTGLFQPGKTYQITAIKTRAKLFFTVEGDGKLRKYSWDLNKPEGIEEGRIGLRHMYTRSATYSDFKVWIKRKK